jgi:hypothetical protein
MAAVGSVRTVEIGSVRDKIDSTYWIRYHPYSDCKGDWWQLSDLRGLTGSKIAPRFYPSLVRYIDIDCGIGIE